MTKLNLADVDIPDAIFIAAARTLVPELADEVERLRAKVEELERRITDSRGHDLIEEELQAALDVATIRSGK